MGAPAMPQDKPAKAQQPHIESRRMTCCAEEGAKDHRFVGAHRADREAAAELGARSVCGHARDPPAHTNMWPAGSGSSPLVATVWRTIQSITRRALGLKAPPCHGMISRSLLWAPSLARRMPGIKRCICVIHKRRSIAVVTLLSPFPVAIPPRRHPWPHNRAPRRA